MGNWSYFTLLITAFLAHLVVIGWLVMNLLQNLLQLGVRGIISETKFKKDGRHQEFYEPPQPEPQPQPQQQQQQQQHIKTRQKLPNKTQMFSTQETL